MWVRTYHRNYRVSAGQLMQCRQLLRGNQQPVATLQDDLDLHARAAHEAIKRTDQEMRDVLLKQKAASFEHKGWGRKVWLTKAEEEKTQHWVGLLQPLFDQLFSAIESHKLGRAPDLVEDMITILIEADDWAMHLYCQHCEKETAIDPHR
jgi:hypothetical protein